MAIDSQDYDVPVAADRWDRVRFRLEHWLLSPGGTEMGRLRGYLRVKEWRRCATPQERTHALKVAAKLPARALRESWRAVRENGEPAAREFGVSPHRQLLHLWWLWVRHGVYPWVYYGYQLYRPGQLRRGPAFFQGKEDDWLFRLANVRTSPDEAELLLDKARCEQWLVDHDLPTVRTLLELSGGAVVRSAIPAEGLPRRDLFSKPNDSLQGRGAQCWRFDGEGWVGGEGRRSEAELIAELTEQSRTQSVLLQEQLRNHPALAPLAPATLSTVRVLTLRGLDGVVRVLLAVAKIPVGLAPTDHMKYGGLAAPIDLATGRLGRAITRSKRTDFFDPCERHPDTGVTIEGFQLPHWESVLQLAERAHRSLDRITCVGWDIAILEDGPIIIEGNDNPGHTSSQLPTGIAFGETAVVPTLLARIQASFAQAPPTAPSDSPGSAAMPRYPRAAAAGEV